MKEKKIDLAKAYNELVAEAGKVAKKRAELQAEKDKLQQEARDRVHAKPAPISGFDIEDVAADADNRPLEQMYEKIKRIDMALGSPNAIDKEYRHKSVAFVNAYSAEVNEALLEYNKSIGELENRIEEAKKELATLKQAKQNYHIECSTKLVGAGMGTLGHKFWKYPPLVFAERYEKICAKMDNGETVTPYDWKNTFA